MIYEDGEVRELTADDMRLFRPVSEVLPPDVLAALATLRKQRGERGSRRSPTKGPTTIDSPE